VKVKCFDLCEELWTKSRTAYITEHEAEFESLKQAIKEHDIPMPTSKYMYQYNKRNVLPKDKITGENYDIEIQDRQSEKAKLFEKWSYFDEEKKENIYKIYMDLKIPEKQAIQWYLYNTETTENYKVSLNSF